jgi:hypothetical protein
MSAKNNGVNWITSENNISNFLITETACPCGCGFNAPHQALIDVLQMIRNYLDVPIKINSCCRCERENARIGGVRNSYHTQGMAADIAIFNSEAGHDLESEKLFLAINFLEIPTIIRYEGRFFCHIDIRPGTHRLTKTPAGFYIPIGPDTV